MSTWNQCGEPPNNNYKKLFDSFLEIESLSIDQWKQKHLLGYFLKKYFETYKTPFQLSCNTPAPGKCRELYELGRIKYMLSSDPLIVKEYIDWAFETQLIKQKKRITSLRFLTTDTGLTEYKNIKFFNPKKKITRSQTLPQYVIDIFFLYERKISTFGELAFLNQCQSDPSIKLIFDKLKESNFNLDLLKEVM